MFYLVHAGKHAELAAISSVSGGSITNGVLAHEFPDLRSADDAEFAGKVQHLVRNVADVGLFFWGPRTNRYVLVTLALAIVTGAGLLTTIVWTAITGLRLGAFICLIVTAVLAVIATALFERRSVTADRALAAEHFSTTASRRSGPGGERVGAAGLAPGQARVAGRGTRGQRPPCGQGRHVPPPSAIWRPGSSCITALRLRSLSHHGNDPAMRSMTYTAPVLGVLAGVVGIADTIPYVRDTIRGSTRPHRGTWLIWSVLAIVVFLSQRADGATWSLIMAAAQAVLTGAIFLLSIRRGEGGLSPADVLMLTLASGGVIGWIVADKPVIATACVVAADLIGAAMMVPKTYRDPGSETLATFALASLSGALATGAVGTLDPSLLLYPVYYCLANGALAVLIHHRRRLLASRQMTSSSARSLR